MTKRELFNKYSINKDHIVWDYRIDSWMSVEIYRVMHEGYLPPKGDMSVDWVLKFLDSFNDNPEFRARIMTRPERDWGSLYNTAHRMVYRHHEEILKSIKS